MPTHWENAMQRGCLRRAMNVSAVAIVCTGILTTTLTAQSSAIPTPASILGYPIGADFKLANYEESMRYFQALAKASDQIKLIDVGKTSTGHPWTLALISSPANLAKLDRYRDIARRLPHPTGLTHHHTHALPRAAHPFV